MPLATEEVHKRTENIYKSISEQYNSNLKTFLLAARAYEKALAGVSNASRHYYDSMNRLGIVVSESTSAKELGECMRQTSDTLREIQLCEDETNRFLRDEFVEPLESKLEQDQKFIYGAYRKYQMDYKVKAEDVERAVAYRQKVRKKSMSGREPYKYDEKQRELSGEVEMKQKAMEQFQYDNLKQAFVEERRRYCFFTEQQSSYMKRCISYHERSIALLKDQLNKCLDGEVSSLPHTAFELLEQVKSHTDHSLTMTPNPPADRPINGFDLTPPPATLLTGSPERTQQAPFANPTNHNIIPRESRKKVRCQYDHDVPLNSTRLGFKKGDIIILMIPQPRDGWHFGENDRTKMRGWFPYSYTKLMKPQEMQQEFVQGQMPLPAADYNVDDMSKPAR